MVIEKNGKNGLTWGMIVPWFIAIVSLTFFVSDRLNAPAKAEAAVTGQISEIRTDVKWLKDNVGELRRDFTRHVDAGK